MNKIICIVLMAIALSGPAFSQDFTISLGNDKGYAEIEKAFKDAGLGAKPADLPLIRAISLIDSGEPMAMILADSEIDNSFKTKVVLIGFGDKPLMEMKTLVYVRPEDKSAMQNSSSWSTKTIGSMRGDGSTIAFCEKYDIKKIEYGGSMEALVTMLAAKRVDMIIGLQGLIDGIAKTQKAKIGSLDQAVDSLKIYLIIPEKFAGTSVEKKLRDSFLKNRKLIESSMAASAGGPPGGPGGLPPPPPGEKPLPPPGPKQ
jgi:hypothetical protein